MTLQTQIPPYAVSDDDWKRLFKNFTYHAPKADQAGRYNIIRAEAKELAETLVKNCPPSRELSLALTKLEEAVMWANAAIARNE